MNPQLWNIPDNPETNETDEVAKIVSTNVCKTQQLVFTLHGEKSKTRKRLDIYAGSFNKSELYTKAGTTVVIGGNSERSYVLDGLNRNTIVFKRKINHLMIRDSDDTRIYLNGGTISGIDVLKGSNVSVRTPKHNFTNVEKSHHTQLGGAVDDDTLIHVTHSMDVFVNQKNLGVNPFSQSQLKLVYTTNDDENRIDIGEMSCSPTDRSFAFERPTKLMIKTKK